MFRSRFPRLLALMAILAAPVAAQSAMPAPGTQVTSYDVTFSPFFLADTGEAGPSKGDSIIFDDVLLQNGKKVGQQVGSCMITSVSATGLLASCSLVIRLPGGEIALQGLISTDPTKRLIVTGGTGVYVNARGSATVVEFGKNEAGRLTLSLLR